MDADRSFVSALLVGGRHLEWANELMGDCASRIRGRVQITTDGHRAYLEAIENAFGAILTMRNCRRFMAPLPKTSPLLSSYVYRLRYESCER